MERPWAADEFDILINEPDPDIRRIRFDWDALREHLTPIRDAARAEKARLRAEKRAAEEAAATAARDRLAT